MMRLNCSSPVEVVDDFGGEKPQLRHLRPVLTSMPGAAEEAYRGLFLLSSDTSFLAWRSLTLRASKQGSTAVKINAPSREF